MNNFYNNSKNQETKTEVWKDRTDNIVKKILEDLIKLGEDLPEDKRRGLSEETIEDFKLFYLTHEKLEKLKDKYNAQELIKSGLFKYECQICEEGYRKTFTSRENIQAHIKGSHNSGFEKFSEDWLKTLLPEECVLIPYLDDNNNLVYLNARDLNWNEEKAAGKYRRPHHSSKEAKEFFQDGIYQATGRDSDILVVTEGEFDALAAYEEGYDAVSIGGVSTKPETKDRLAQIIKEYDKAVYVADNDIPGLEALGILSGELRLRDAEIKGQISEGEDLSDQVEQGENIEVEGQKVTDILMDNFEELIDNEDKLNTVEDAEELFYHSLQGLKKTRWKPKVKALADRMGEILEDKPDKHDLKKACGEYLEELEGEMKERKSNKKGRKLSKEKKRKAKEFWNQENVVRKILDNLSQKVKEDREGCLLTLKVATSCYASEPINLYLKGPSSIGKTYLATSVGELFPEEDVMFLGGMSPTAFYHDKGKIQEIEGEKKKVISLNNKLIIFLDVPNTELLESLKPILSHDKEEIEYQYTDEHLGVTKAVVRGHPAVIFCTTESKTLEEMATRGLSYSPKLSNKKIKASLDLQTERAISPELKEFQERKFKNMRHNFRYLKRQNIKIRLHGASKFKKWFWDQQSSEEGQVNQRVMRDFQKILKLVEMSTFLNYVNRDTITINGDQYTIPKNIDYLTGLNLWEMVKEMTVKGVSKRVLQILDCIRDLKSEEGKKKFTVEEIRDKYKKEFHEKLNINTLRNKYLNEVICEELGALTKEKDPEDKRKNIYKAVDLEVKKKEEKDRKTLKNLIIPKEGFISPERLNKELKEAKKKPYGNEIYIEDTSTNQGSNPYTEFENYKVLVKLFDGSISEKRDLKTLYEKFKVKYDNSGKLEKSEEDKENKSETEDQEEEDNEENKQNIEDLISEDPDVGASFNSIHNYIEETGNTPRASKVKEAVSDKHNIDNSFISKQLKNEDSFKIENNRVYARGD